MLWVCTWTPYMIVTVMGIASIATRDMLTPVGVCVPSFIAKSASCLNPIVFALSHPKYGQQPIVVNSDNSLKTICFPSLQIPRGSW